MFSVGDQVSFLREALRGKVLEVRGRRVLVEDEHGFERDVALTDLVLCLPGELYKLGEHISDKEQVKERPSKKRKTKVLSYGKILGDQAMEIDLHIEELTESHVGLSNADIVQLQLKIFRRAIGEAIEMRLRKLIVIHGVGMGVLKEEIRRELADYPGYEYVDADYRKYGYGATEIVMRR